MPNNFGTPGGITKVVIENCSNVFKNDIKEIHSEFVRISHNFEELMVHVQKNHEEYVHQLKIMNTAIQKAVTKQTNPTPSKALEGNSGEKMIFCVKLKIFNSTKEPLADVEDQNTLGLQVLHKPFNFSLADELMKNFELLSLRKLTKEKLFNSFGDVNVAENSIFFKPINYLAYVTFSLHWLCGAHQKNILAFWLFMLQYYYIKKSID